MKIAVVGAGSVGLAIARELVRHGHEIVLIDNSPDAIHVSEVPQADWALADACSPSALEGAEVRSCDSLVAATGDDKVNLVVSLLAKSEFAVPKVIARINDPGNEWMFTGSWGVDIPVSTPRVMAALVEEAIQAGGAVNLLSLNNRQVGFYALVIPEDSPLVGAPPADVAWPEGAVVTTVLRDGVPAVLADQDALLGGDELLVACANPQADQAIKELEQLFRGPDAGGPAH